MHPPARHSSRLGQRFQVALGAAAALAAISLSPGSAQAYVVTVGGVQYDVILLDTNICIHIINARPAAVLERFRLYRMGEIGVSSVVAAELAYGVVKSGSSRNRQALEMFLAPLIILPFDEAVIWAYGELREALLVTNNTREFARVPGLRLENWVPGA